MGQLTQRQVENGGMDDRRVTSQADSRFDADIRKHRESLSNTDNGRLQAKTSCELVARYIYEKLGIEFKPIRPGSIREREKIPAIGESRI